MPFSGLCFETTFLSILILRSICFKLDNNLPQSRPLACLFMHISGVHILYIVFLCPVQLCSLQPYIRTVGTFAILATLAFGPLYWKCIGPNMAPTIIILPLKSGHTIIYRYRSVNHFWAIIINNYT